MERLRHGVNTVPRTFDYRLRIGKVIKTFVDLETNFRKFNKGQRTDLQLVTTGMEEDVRRKEHLR